MVVAMLETRGRLAASDPCVYQNVSGALSPRCLVAVMEERSLAACLDSPIEILTLGAEAQRLPGCDGLVGSAGYGMSLDDRKGLQRRAAISKEFLLRSSVDL